MINHGPPHSRHIPGMYPAYETLKLGDHDEMLSNIGLAAGAYTEIGI